MKIEKYKKLSILFGGNLNFITVKERKIISIEIGAVMCAY
jgi:hypothetical protein